MIVPSRYTWTKVLAVLLLLAAVVVAPFGESVGVPRKVWEFVVGLPVVVGLYVLFRE